MANENIDNNANEQITKVPDAAKPATKNKDPKKVAAGTKLAEYNKKAKEALAREIKRDADSEEIKASDGESWLPELSFSTVLTVVGIGVTIADLFFRFYRTKTEKDNFDLAPVHIALKKSPEPEVPQQKSCPQPRIGMALKDILTINKQCLNNKIN